MKKIIKLTEGDLKKIVQIVMEQSKGQIVGTGAKVPQFQEVDYALADVGKKTPDKQVKMPITLSKDIFLDNSEKININSEDYKNSLMAIQDALNNSKGQKLVVTVEGEAKGGSNNDNLAKMRAQNFINSVMRKFANSTEFQAKTYGEDGDFLKIYFSVY